MPLHEGADHLVAQSLGRGIDRQDAAVFRRERLVVVGEDQELARRQLPAVIEAHGAGHQQRLPDLDGPVEKRLARPGAFDDTGGVAQHGAEDPQPLACRHHALVHDPPDAGDLVARPGHARPG